tara:strand:+ start:573 stop:2696 length:2124 start_codon:yes stop_codon:yes gene_type:complete
MIIKTACRQGLATPHKVDFNLLNSGVWTSLPNGDKIWQLSIICPDALSINLLYDQFWLPEGAKFFLYTDDQTHMIGAFTSRNNKGSIDKLQGFATGLLYGEKIILEYYLPKEAREIGVISIASVIHGYRYIDLQGESSKSLGSSGNCQVNVNCNEGTNWQQEKNAVAMILVNGNRYCTGSLINTTCTDDRPLLLTADHCLGGWANNNIKHDAITNPALNHWSFYWHYERPGCPNTGSPPLLSTSGATVVANNGATDFALLELTEDPADKNGVTPYYLGWDRSGNPGTGGVGIHHPSGDAKKISTYTITPRSTNYLSSTTNSSGSYWRVTWAATTVDHHGVTEGGSSGSSLINSNFRVIGQLRGGTSSCTLKNDPDWYGKFSLSWTGNGAVQQERRLDHWLHPGGGTAPNTLDGKAGTNITGPDRICTTNTNFTLQNVPAGQTVTWAVSPTYLFPSTGRTGTGTTATLRAAGTSVSGAATLTYTVDTDCGEYEVSREIWVGVPNTSMQVDANYYPICLNEYTYINAFYDPYNTNPEGNKDTDITNFIWQQPAGVSCFTAGTRNEVLACWFTTPNMYTVRVRAVNSCGQGAFQNVYLNVYGCSYYTMSLNPNPANGRVRIALTEMPLDESAKAILQSENKTSREYQEYSFDSPPQRIRVFDLTGAERICVEDPPSDSSYELDISHLRPGVYVVHLDHRNGTVTRQLRVE